MGRSISISIKPIVIVSLCIIVWLSLLHHVHFDEHTTVKTTNNGRRIVEKTANLTPKYDVLVVGAGLSGAVMAHLHAKLLNKKVLVVEKRNHIGGNCYDYINDVGIRVSMYGAHSFHTKHHRVWQFVQTVLIMDPIWIQVDLLYMISKAGGKT